MKGRYINIFAVAAALTIWPVIASAAADPDDRCAGGKLKGAGLYGKLLLSCEAAAVKQEQPVDAACQAKALAKLNSAFGKAEGRGGCATTGDAGTVADAVEADVAAVVSDIIYDDDRDARYCAAAKLNAAGKHYAARMGCYSKAAKRGAALDADCGTRADSSLQQSFTKLESTGSCTTEDDAAEIADLNQGGVIEVVAAVSPLCGDDVAGPTNACDGTDDASCPGLCEPTCTCDVPPECGDGAAELPEECDDGANVDGDGCSAACVLEDTTAVCDGVATTSGTALDAVLVAEVDQPIHIAAPPLDPSRLFIVEKPGRIRVVELEGDTLLSTPYLDIVSKVSESGEQGLLSMAFHPDFENNGWFYVFYTDNSGDEVIARYEAADPDDNTVSVASEKILLVVEDFASNHNGGQLEFGPDGYLYAGMGDGGGGGDPNETGQDDSTLLGKMLRLDVDLAVDAPPYWEVPASNSCVTGTDELELIWAKGLRNPWRWSFDRATGDMLIADVGQGSWEEINFQPAASTGCENYGWDIFEADMCFESDPAPTCPGPAGFTFPIHKYSHSVGCSITGGFVYRGCAMPDLAGRYFYSDFCTPFIKTFTISGGTAQNHNDVTSSLTPEGTSIDGVSSFGQDARGELYIADLGGEVFRIVPAAP